MLKKVPPETAGLLAMSFPNGSTHHSMDLFSFDAVLDLSLSIANHGEHISPYGTNTMQNIRACFSAVQNNIASPQRSIDFGQKNSVTTMNQERRHAVSTNEQRKLIYSFQQYSVFIQQERRINFLRSLLH